MRHFAQQTPRACKVDAAELQHTPPWNSRAARTNASYCGSRFGVASNDFFTRVRSAGVGVGDDKRASSNAASSPTPNTAR